MESLNTLAVIKDTDFIIARNGGLADSLDALILQISGLGDCTETDTKIIGVGYISKTQPVPACSAALHTIVNKLCIIRGGKDCRRQKFVRYLVPCVRDTSSLSHSLWSCLELPVFDITPVFPISHRHSRGLSPRQAEYKIELAVEARW